MATKRENFVALREIVAENQELVDFINHEIELLDKKSNKSRTPSAKQIENEGFKAEIVSALATADKPVTIKELCVLCPSIAELTNQRITHMLTDLRKNGVVAREYVKKVAHFYLGNEVEAEAEAEVAE